VVVVDRSDIAAGASSRSSHMVHGGLRYLEHGHFGLVREALLERAVLVRMAPHLVRPARFLIPFGQGDRRPPWMLGIGLKVYDWLAGSANLDRHQVVSLDDARVRLPGLPAHGLRGGAIYSDAVMDDARLTLAVALDAIEHGAEVATHTEVTGAHPTDDGMTLLARDRLTDESREWEARVVVNATGAWNDDVRQLLLGPGAHSAPMLRPSRGSHIVFPPLSSPSGMLFFARSDGRVMFLVPIGDYTLLGTTETDRVMDAGEDLPPEDEVRYLLREGQGAIPGAELTAERALGLMTGVRPLVRAAHANLGKTPREHRIRVDGRVVSVVGGKYTTFRPMCADVMRSVCGLLGRDRVSEDEAPLPGGEIPSAYGGNFERFLAEEAMRLAPVYPGAVHELPRLIQAHGARAARVLERDPEGARPLILGLPVLAAEVRYAVEVERARTLDDVMRRRTLLWISRDFGRVAAAPVAQCMAPLLGWDADRTRDELARWWRFSSGEEHLLKRAAEQQ